MVGVEVVVLGTIEMVVGIVAGKERLILFKMMEFQNQNMQYRKIQGSILMLMRIFRWRLVGKMSHLL